MAVYTDGTHLIAANEKELHLFAIEIGLKFEWFQKKRLPHYDLTTVRMMNKAIKAGAKLVTSRDIVLILLKGELDYVQGCTD
jgi:hypothetical protein